jgi:hypothetical protein
MGKSGRASGSPAELLASPAELLEVQQSFCQLQIIQRIPQNFQQIHHKNQSRKSDENGRWKVKSNWKLTESAPMGDNDKFSTVARSSSTEAEIGAVPLFSGLISTWIFLSISSSLSLSELE